jgi:hypothetical protein
MKISKKKNSLSLIKSWFLRIFLIESFLTLIMKILSIESCDFESKKFFLFIVIKPKHSGEQRVLATKNSWKHRIWILRLYE